MLQSLAYLGGSCLGTRLDEMRRIAHGKNTYAIQEGRVGNSHINPLVQVCWHLRWIVDIILHEPSGKHGEPIVVLQQDRVTDRPYIWRCGKESNVCRWAGDERNRWTCTFQCLRGLVKNGGKVLSKRG